MSRSILRGTLTNLCQEQVSTPSGTVDKRDKFKLQGNTIAGTFRVDEVVAEGGFGIVYRAFHLHFRSPVALKCLKIPGELSEDERTQFLEQFRSEAEIQFRLSAALPNIVRPLHVDAIHTDDGEFIPMMALEWLEGLSFETIIENKSFADEPPIPLPEALELIGPAAQALHQAHNFEASGEKLAVIHRDIKPDNLLLTEINGKKVVKILDFGISKVRRAATQLAGHFSQTGGTAPFSPAYGAPEQWVPKRFGQTGPWTDVWGLALTLVEIIKGDAVIVGDHQAMMGTTLDPKVRPSPRSEGVKVSDEVESVFLKALALDPRFRYQSIQAFWESLQAAVLYGTDGSVEYQETPSGSRIELPPMSAPTPWKSPADAFEETNKKAHSLPPMLAPAKMKRTTIEDQKVLEEERAARASYPMDPNSDLQPVPAAPTDWNHFDPEVPPSSQDPTSSDEASSDRTPRSQSEPQPLEPPPPLEAPVPQLKRDEPSLKLELAETSVFPSKVERRRADELAGSPEPATRVKAPTPAPVMPREHAMRNAETKPTQGKPVPAKPAPAKPAPAKPAPAQASPPRTQPTSKAARRPVPQARSNDHPEIPDLAPTAPRSPAAPSRSSGVPRPGLQPNAQGQAKGKAHPQAPQTNSVRPPPPRRSKKAPPAPSRKASAAGAPGKSPPPPQRPNRPPPPQRSDKEGEDEEPLQLVPTGKHRSAG